MRTEFLKPSSTWTADKRSDRFVGNRRAPPIRLLRFEAARPQPTATAGLATAEERVDLFVPVLKFNPFFSILARTSRTIRVVV